MTSRTNHGARKMMVRANSPCGAGRMPAPQDTRTSKWVAGMLALAACACCLATSALGQTGGAEALDLVAIRPAQTGFAHAGWAYDRYTNLDKLDAKHPMLMADLTGPGIIHCIHSTRHAPKELNARGIVLEIWFDDAKEPAVQCPLADFFGDGCNGQAMDFSSKFIECAPWSYNAYFPMPFRSRARVFLRNDTDKDLGNYSFVEWEPLAKWDDSLGYFHATYQRKCFQLTPKSDETFFEIKGRGHLLGRQYSIVTDEPRLRGFWCVMEGNNEVDIDGQERRLDYLGTEDSFTFSWGFQKPFAGLRAGMTLVQQREPSQLSIYRFHDYLPIRFDRSLRWHINWSNEKGFFKDAKWAEALARDGCWLDYATVHYWYQDTPGGFQHAELAPVAERVKPLLRSSLKPATEGSPEKKNQP